MSLSKFLAIVSGSALYFPQLEALTARDPFEGRYTAMDRHVANAIESNDVVAQSLLGEGVDPNFRRAMGPEGLDQMENAVRRSFYISCWHVNDYESAGLWSAYAQEVEGIAVRSTVGALRESLGAADEKIFIGRVNYIDTHRTQIGRDNMFRSVFSKRRSFSFESELRACILQAGPYEQQLPGLSISCAPNILIKAIHVAPFSPGWFKDLVTELVRKYSLDKEVRQSSLVDESLV